MKTRKRYKKLTCGLALTNRPAKANGKDAGRMPKVNGRVSLTNSHSTPETTALDPQAGELRTIFIAPRTPSEKLMACILEQTLKVEQIGVLDNFFDIVHDSFSAMEVIEQTRKAFAVNLPVSDLFADPTVAGMTAAVLRRQQQNHGKPFLVNTGPELWTQKNGRSRYSPRINKLLK